MNNKTKALVVFSGGLDSILAVKTLQAQNIEVTALTFVSNFYDAKKAQESCRELGVDHRVIDIKEKMLDLVKNPPHGYGKNMNPCVDCHAMMFRLASQVMKKEGYDLLASGEVLGQRPFSQNKDSLLKVQELAGVEILRPLSAKLLDETSYEKETYVNRGRLHRIEGRTREGQMELVKRYGIKEFPSPAGGCLLTDPDFSGRLLKMIDNWPEASPDDVEILKCGRVLWVNDNSSVVVVGRHKEDNDCLEKLAKKGDIVLQLKEINGPTTLFRGYDYKGGDIKLAIPDSKNSIDFESKGDNLVKEIAKLTGFYAVKARGTEQLIEIKVV